MTTLARQQPRYPVELVPQSSLHGVFRATQRWVRTNGRDAICLHVGEPAYTMPPAAVDAMYRAMRDDRCSYTSAEGMRELREALVDKLARQGIATTVDRVFVTPGSCQGLVAVGAAIYEPGAAWMIPQVHWPIYRQQGILNGYQTVAYPLGANYTLDVASIARAATPRTRAIMVNSPANPTGVVADVSTLRELLDLARRRDWIIISDEAYEDFVYDGEHVPLASLEADVEPPERRVFSAFTFSKSHAMTGCRVGYIVAPNDRLADLLMRVQEASIIAPPTPSQIGALAALDATDLVRANVAAVRARRDAVMGDLMTAGLIDVPPAGGWYALLDISSSGYPAEEFAGRLLEEHGVAVAPAGAFTLPDDPRALGLVRISLAGDTARLVEGIATLVRACREWGDQRR